MKTLFVVAASLTISGSALAQGPDQHPPPATEKISPAMGKAKYSLPFSLRPAAPPNLLRIDAPVAVQDAQTTMPTTLTGGARVHPDVGLYARMAFVRNAPEGASAGHAASNPLAFALWSPQIAPKLRLPIFVGVAFPVGGGGGNDPNLGTRAAMGAGIYGRQAMDNALFASNYLTPTVGAGIAWIDKGWTVQVEATVLQLLRARGSAVDADVSRTNFTSGASVGYLVAGVVNVSAEIHYQRWLSTPAAVSKDPSLREQMTVGGGARFNVPLTDTILMRPGLAYFQGVDDPMARLGYRIMQVDLPILF